MIKPVNENTSFGFEVETKDLDGNPYTATKIQYVIDDVTSGQRVKQPTNVTPTSSVTIITISIADNQIINGILPFEERVISYQVYVGADVKKSGEYRYYCKNLFKIPIQAS